MGYFFGIHYFRKKEYSLDETQYKNFNNKLITLTGCVQKLTEVIEIYVLGTFLELNIYIFSLFPGSRSKRRSAREAKAC